MPYDTQEWDDRYRKPGYWAGSEPAEFLREVLPLLPRGSALDLASGECRTTVYLDRKGFHVFALERSRVGLEKTEALAREGGIACRWATQITAPHRHEAPLTLLEANLESFAFPTERFDVVLCIKYLQRPLFPFLQRALRHGGMLVYETYTLAQQKFADGPRNLEFLLRPGELRTAFS